MENKSESIFTVNNSYRDISYKQITLEHTIYERKFKSYIRYLRNEKEKT
jgi:hypothetical protein